MTGVEIDLAEARLVLGVAAGRARALIASIPDATLRARRLDWTLGETVAHLVADIRRFGDMALGRLVPSGGAEQVAAVNAGDLVTVPERDPARLSGLFTDAVRQYLAETRTCAGNEPVAWYGGHQITVAAVTCLLLGEVVVHGYDVASTIGRKWPIDRREASLALDGAAWVLPSMVDQQAADGMRASYDLRVRGGSRVQVRFESGTVTVESGAASNADCHISADPVAFLLVGYGRWKQWGPIITGRLVAWGPKPWLGLKFVDLVRSP